METAHLPKALLLQPGRVLKNKFRIEKLIGRGGSGDVYRASQLIYGEYKRLVAVKVLRLWDVNDPDALERFKLEAQRMAELKHPNIVRVIDADEEGEVPFFVMDYMSGGTLREELARQRLSVEKGVRLIADVAAALAAAHDAEFIHRDVKPENIFLEGDVALLGDFGLLKVPGEKRTPSGAILGTPSYIAPEIWGLQPADSRSDIFSLGCVLYEVLAGQPLFPTTGRIEIVAAQVRDPNPVALEIDGLPPPLLNLLGRCLEKDPNDRLATASELEAELRRCVSDLDLDDQVPATPASSPNEESQGEDSESTPPPVPVETLEATFSSRREQGLASARLVAAPPSKMTGWLIVFWVAVLVGILAIAPVEWRRTGPAWLADRWKRIVDPPGETQRGFTAPTTSARPMSATSSSAQGILLLLDDESLLLGDGEDWHPLGAPSEYVDYRSQLATHNGAHIISEGGGRREYDWGGGGRGRTAIYRRDTPKQWTQIGMVDGKINAIVGSTRSVAVGGEFTGLVVPRQESSGTVLPQLTSRFDDALSTERNKTDEDTANPFLGLPTSIMPRTEIRGSSNVMVWDGEWKALGNGLEWPVLQLVAWNNKLVAEVHNKDSSHLETWIWDGKAWSAKGASRGRLIVYDDSLVVIGGSHSSRWTGTEWEALSWGELPGGATCAAVHDGYLFVGLHGDALQRRNGSSYPTVFYLRDDSWMPVPYAPNGSVSSLLTYRNVLVAVGEFDRIGHLSMQNVGVVWEPE